MMPGANYQPSSITLFDYQGQTSIQQVNPVLDTWYTVLDTAVPGRLHRITCEIETVNETLELELTISGGAPIVNAIAAAHTTQYILAFADNSGNVLDFQLELWNPEHRTNPQFDYSSLLVRIRKTTAAGAGNLNCKTQHSNLIKVNI